MFRKSPQIILLIFALFFSFALTVHAQPIDALFHDANDPVAGNPKGKITVVEFFDYQCSYCAGMTHVMDAVIRTNPNVRVVYKEYPIRGQMSEFASRAALAANKQGKYLPLNHALLNTNMPLTQSTVFTLAQKVGLNVTRLKQDMYSSSINKTLKNNYQLARTLNLTGTPSFFIGITQAKNSRDVKYVIGQMSQNELQNTIRSLE